MRTNDVLLLLGLAGVAYALYEAARRGDLGLQARELVMQIQGSTTYQAR